MCDNCDFSTMLHSSREEADKEAIKEGVSEEALRDLHNNLAGTCPKCGRSKLMYEEY